MIEVRSPHDPEYKTLEPDNSEWESVKIMKRSELNADEVERKKVEVSIQKILFFLILILLF